LGVGQAAARDHDVWLLTMTGNARFFEPMRNADPRLKERLHPVYLHIGHGTEKRMLRGRFRLVYHILWQLGLCRRAARRLHAEINFDIAPHITYAADWAPAGVAFVPGLPFVWGPVGGPPTPFRFRLVARLGARAMLTELVRLAIIRPLRVVVGGALVRNAAVVLAQNPDVAERFPTAALTVEPHVAVEGIAIPAPARLTNPVGGPPVAVYAGRLLAWKGVRLGMAALRRDDAAEWRFDIYGHGPERRRLESLATQWGLAERVRFFGRRPRSEVLAAIARADVLLHPSVHDAAGWVIAEALVAGCPVVALRADGPAVLVGDTDGVLVHPRGDVVGKLSSALNSARPMRPTAGDRWLASRLPDLVTEIYSQATKKPVLA
jgi:glycosyltransferase involved in cell wall biosynthesis